MIRIYHVGLRLTRHCSAALGSPDKQLHATIAYSRTWFPYRPPTHVERLVVRGPFWFDEFDGPTHVLRFNCPSLAQRHEELIAAGASWDHPTFLPHVSIPEPLPDLLHLHNLVFDQEYYRTWEPK